MTSNWRIERGHRFLDSIVARPPGHGADHGKQGQRTGREREREGHRHHAPCRSKRGRAMTSRPRRLPKDAPALGRTSQLPHAQNQRRPLPQDVDKFVDAVVRHLTPRLQTELRLSETERQPRAPRIFSHHPDTGPCLFYNPPTPHGREHPPPTPSERQTRRERAIGSSNPGGIRPP
jgi:hypothetical protein